MTCSRQVRTLVVVAALAAVTAGCERSARPASAPGSPDASPRAAAAASPGSVAGPAKVASTDEAERRAQATAAEDAAAIAAACELLAKDPRAAPVPGTRDYLCQGKVPTCNAGDERSCRELPLCFARAGSGSGEGCSPCTPDWEFYGCEPYPKASLAKQVLQARSKGQDAGPR